MGISCSLQPRSAVVKVPANTPRLGWHQSTPCSEATKVTGWAAWVEATQFDCCRTSFLPGTWSKRRHSCWLHKPIRSGVVQMPGISWSLVHPEVEALCALCHRVCRATHRAALPVESPPSLTELFSCLGTLHFFFFPSSSIPPSFLNFRCLGWYPGNSVTSHYGKGKKKKK